MNTAKLAPLALLAFTPLFPGCVAQAAESPNMVAPLYHEATNEFRSMQTTIYQHKTQVNRAAGNYGYDCVGFVSYALRTAAPRAWKSVVMALDLPRGRIPSPPKYRKFFAGLAAQAEPGWQAVTNAADLRPGDVVAWEHKTTNSSGHAVIIGSMPLRGSQGSWVVEVYDSTSSPHTDDSRPGDPRAQVLASTGRHSGLGHGVMVFLADEGTGALTGLRWGKQAKAITVPIAAGRPTS